MDFGNDKAIYLQITDYICEQILNGRWRPDERLVSVRELASSMEVNPNTVMRSYNELADRDIIVNKRGIGFFVSTDAPELIRNEQRAAFVHDELPRIFKKMRLLNISMEEIAELYQSTENQ